VWDCLWSKGAITPNEIREERGMKPLIGGDTSFVPFSVVPLGGAPEEKKTEEKKLRTPLSREKIVESYLVRFTKNEKNIMRKQREIFEDQEKKIIEKIHEKQKSMKPEDVIPPMSELNEEFIRIMYPVLLSLVAEEGAEALNEINLDMIFRLDSPEVRAELKKLSVRFASDVNETTVNRIREQLSEGIQKGEGADDLASRVQEVFSVAKKSRTVVIARTETLRAANSAHALAYQQAGVQKWEWLSVEDKNSRPHHAAASGQIREIGKPFDIGGELMVRPGEGSAANVVNCRCRTIAVI
jgi:SPP1 gp7 family putative phage head morphogenesis protein